jgi:hypothetical protein
VKVTTDNRVTRAREYLSGARRRKVTELPPPLLERECAELRRQVGQLLDVVDEAIALAADDSTGVWLDGSATLTPADVKTVLGALDDGSEYKRDRANGCPDCAFTEGGLCAACDSRLATATAYDVLARTLRGAR